MDDRIHLLNNTGRDGRCFTVFSNSASGRFGPLWYGIQRFYKNWMYCSNNLTQCYCSEHEIIYCKFITVDEFIRTTFVVVQYVGLYNEFLDNMIRSGHRRLARSFNPGYRYIDDLIVFNNKKFLDYLKEIYPSQLTVEKANKSDHLADYLNLTFIIDSGGKLSTRLYDKRDDFDFHIVNFPYLSSNIPSGPSYGVYISQLIRYARRCSHCDDFRYCHKCLVDRLLSQGYIALRLEKSFKKFYGRYQDLTEKYQRSVNVMVNGSFPG